MLGRHRKLLQPPVSQRRQHKVLDAVFRKPSCQCHGCGAILDLDDTLVQPLRDAIAARYDFATGIDHLALFGYCAACHPHDK